MEPLVITPAWDIGDRVHHRESGPNDGGTVIEIEVYRHHSHDRIIGTILYLIQFDDGTVESWPASELNSM